MNRSTHPRTTLKAAREASGYTQPALAAAADVSMSYICKLEHGDSWPTLPVARRIAAVLDTTPDALWPPVEER